MVPQIHDGHEERLRVICHLPVNNSRQLQVVDRFVNHLRELRTKNGGIDVGGFTHSQVLPPVFGGYWWSDDRQAWVKDGIAVFMIDYRVTGDVGAVAAGVADLKKRLTELYREYTGGEEEVWVVAHSIIRQM
jgi:hypothetical protein